MVRYYRPLSSSNTNKVSCKNVHFYRNFFMFCIKSALFIKHSGSQYAVSLSSDSFPIFHLPQGYNGYHHHREPHHNPLGRQANIEKANFLSGFCSMAAFLRLLPDVSFCASPPPAGQACGSIFFVGYGSTL